MPIVLPRRIIDLSPTLTEDLPRRLWGTEVLARFGFSETLNWKHIVRRPPNPNWKAYIANSFLELPTHGGPHVDGPNHMIEGGASVADYSLDLFVGPISLIDARRLPLNESVPLEFIRNYHISPGDIAILLTGFVPPTRQGELPRYQYLSPEAAEYLAELPVKAYGTNGWSVDSPPRDDHPRGGPSVHLSFLRRRIPCIEQLHNLEPLLDEENAVFVGLPLKIHEGNGSPIRAAAFVYE